MDWEIRAERVTDEPAIEALVAASFGPGRYAKSAYRLREGVRPEQGLSFVATENGILRGSVRFWPVVVGDRRVLLLGPLAVQSDQRGRGIGLSLMQAGIEEARKTGHIGIILVGDEPYYARAGFSKLASRSIRFPGPVDHARVLGLALREDAFSGLSGPVKRARLDEIVCADSAPLGG